MSQAFDTLDTRAQWSSEPAFVFSMTAAAVGLGNLWRFPYMVGENGGGAFILAYLICLFVFGFPIMLLEVGTGRLATGNTVKTFRKAHRKFGSLFGSFVVLLTVAITSYYLVITGWTLGYAVSALSFDISSFDEFTSGYNSLYYFFAVTFLCVAILIRGVEAIEKVSKFLMPILLLIIIGLVIIALHLPGRKEASEFILATDFSRLADFNIWFFALGQAFFTLAVGQGYLITYGSYIPEKTNIPRACMIVTITETSIAFLAGWMIFPIVFTYGLDPGEGSALAFNTLPLAFEQMTGGAYLAIGFFSLFFMAAFSSCLAGLKVIIAAIEEEFRFSHTRAILITGGLMIALGVPSALSFSPVSLEMMGMPFLDFVDQFGGTNTVVASGLIGAGIFCWSIPRKKIDQTLGAQSRFWSGKIMWVGRAAPFFLLLIVLLRFV